MTRNNIKSNVTNFRTEPYYEAGLKLILEDMEKQGLKITKTDLIKEGLRKVFSDYRITREDIAEALKTQKS